MATIRDLKKDINFVLGDIIDAVYLWQELNPEREVQEGDAIIDDAIATFDSLIAKVSDRAVAHRSKHLSAVRAELEEEAKKLADRINNL